MSDASGQSAGEIDYLARKNNKPGCHNRPPREQGRLIYGHDRQTGKAIERYLSNDWFVDRCATWDGVGIGKPTAEYPSGAPYPIAHGWDCAGCRWMQA